MDAMEKARRTRQAIIEKRQAEGQAKDSKRADQRARTLNGAILGVVFIVSALMFAAAAWSAGHLVASIPGVPTAYAWGAFSAVEGAWLACVLLIVRWQNDVNRMYQIGKAEALARKAYWGSLLLNFAHGFVLVGNVLGGALAGLALCIFPYAFKELFSVAVTNRVEELRHVGLGEVLTERYQLNALARFHEADTASGQPDTRPDARPDTDGHRTDAPDTRDGQADTERPAPALTGQDARTDAPDELSTVAATASGPADLVRTLSGHGVRLSDLVSEAVRLRPDMNADSIRRTVKRMQDRTETGQYL
ncbi:hypothetical protein [Streptomyces pacificus]|uniref:Uncharacterized protein n=1 Tax=Streptomyces pacificus TaxID=2705029 RepID=A0A6A0AR27_9ACTN|nr:hypothetical protein [Streptomyces pacificus]GFH35449.1 hypothetical protein SCWH03_16650 [Streptomyces pacificus]